MRWHNRATGFKCPGTCKFTGNSSGDLKKIYIKKKLPIGSVRYYRKYSTNAKDSQKTVKMRGFIGQNNEENTKKKIG